MKEFITYLKGNYPNKDVIEVVMITDQVLLGLTHCCLTQCGASWSGSAWPGTLAQTARPRTYTPDMPPAVRSAQAVTDGLQELLNTFVPFLFLVTGIMTGYSVLFLYSQERAVRT